MIITQNLGYPKNWKPTRVKKINEQYRAGKTGLKNVLQVGKISVGVYDIHSPRVPNSNEMIFLLQKAAAVIPAEQLWINPDCGLKTRGWKEPKLALIEMVEAAKTMG